MKYTYNQRMEAVMNVVKKKMSCRQAGEILGCGNSSVKRWVRLYREFGEAGVKVKHGSYTGEFKIKVVEYLKGHDLTLTEVAVKFGIPQGSIIKEWEKIYDDEGKEVLHIERRGRPRSNNGRPTIKKKPYNGDMKKQINDKAKSEKDENDY